MRLLNLTVVAAIAAGLFAQDTAAPRRPEGPPVSGHWALFLRDEPVAKVERSRAQRYSARAQMQRARIRTEQQRLVRSLRARGVHVVGQVDTLLNAVFVAADPATARQLINEPGVIGVVPMPRMKLHMNKALDIVNATAAYSQISGGGDNAGAGIKIGIIDSGLDHTHAAFQDSTLTVPSGYPKCSGDDCNYTNNKIIAARSYVKNLAFVTTGGVFDSRPDDFTPRDRVGHGTAVAMIAAGVRHQPAQVNFGPIQGVAPKAWLGNYKIFGSPGVNDYTFSDVLMMAIEDAFYDGMDIVTLSLGLPAEWWPDDTGSICGRGAGVPCDPWADAVQTLADSGVLPVVSAGNDGDAGPITPTLSTITTPGSTTDALTVGATSNAHRVVQTLRVTGAGVPAALSGVDGFFGTGPRPFSPIEAPLRDVTQWQDDGNACSPLPAGSLAGAFALVQGAGCTNREKVANATAAGARGVVVIRLAGFDDPFPPQGLDFTAIPLFQIGNSAGTQLRQFLAANPGRPVSLDPSWREVTNGVVANQAPLFSSRGPNINGELKPDLVAPGAGIFTATQKLDPNGDMFDASGYTAIQGTSFSVPFAAGAAAILLQKHPNWIPLQLMAVLLKSSLVNSAAPAGLTDSTSSGGPVDSPRGTTIGAGMLDIARALNSDVQVYPTAINFGFTDAALPYTIGLTLFNTSDATATYRISVQPRDADSRASITLSQTTVTLNPMTYNTTAVGIRLGGSRPNTGSYEGHILVEGGAVPLRIPYYYAMRNNQVSQVVPLRNQNFTGVPSSRLNGGLLFKALDANGVPVNGAGMTLTPSCGSLPTASDGYLDCSSVTESCVARATSNTDETGLGEATTVCMGPTLGAQQITVSFPNAPPLVFNGKVRNRPSINANGILNAADGTLGQGLAPGSYASIYGSALADVFLSASTPYLPYSLAGASVSFDVPGQQVGYAGRLHFVSDSQVNVQIPWELQGQTHTLVKLSLGDFTTALYDLQLAPASPAPFQFAEASSGRTLAILTDVNGRLVTSAAALAKGGTYILWANGLGPVSNTPATGEVSPGTNLAQTTSAVTVTIGGRPATVLFSGLTPGNVGLYQVNLTVDPATPSGYQPLVITVNGVSSKTADVPVQ